MLEVVGRGDEFVGELRCELGGAVTAASVELAVDIVGVLDTAGVDEASTEEAVRTSGAATDEQATSNAARTTIVARLITARTASIYWPSATFQSTGICPTRVEVMPAAARPSRSAPHGSGWD